MGERERSDPSQRRRGFVGLEQRVTARFEALRWAPGPPMVVGFSGGADSLALVAVLARLGAASGFEVVALHVDHGLRQGSGDEQRRAEGLAAALGARFVARRVPEVPRLVHPGVGIEEGARRERYRFFADVAAEVGTGVVALGHHQEDQAETVLLHLLRGSGLDGASGMAERTRMRVPWWTDPRQFDAATLVIWRPFLQETKADVRAYAASLGLAPVEDPSNEDRSLRRNRFRHEVLPVLDNAVPGASAALARFAGLAAADAWALDHLAWHAYRRMVTEQGTLPWAAFSREPHVAIARRIVRHWVREQTGYRSMTANRVEAVVRLRAAKQSGRRVDIGERLVVVAEHDALRIESGAAAGEPGEVVG